MISYYSQLQYVVLAYCMTLYYVLLQYGIVQYSIVQRTPSPASARASWASASGGRCSERDKWGQHEWCHCKCYLLLTDILVGTPIKCIFPRMPGRTLFPIRENSLLCSGPVSVDPICPQPMFIWGFDYNFTNCIKEAHP